MAFLIDRFEVTNEQFKQFVDAGGYRDKKFWVQLAPFVVDGKELPFGEFVNGLHDATGRPGPSTWREGSYPRGQHSYPVHGVSWYEAAAYAAYAGKALPTVRQWERAACLDQAEDILSASNFANRGPVAVGACGAINRLGVHDMAGNVKEWCWNSTRDGRRVARGGSWNEHTYMFRSVEAYPPASRGEGTGFRCVLNSTRTPPTELEPLGLAELAAPPVTAFSPADLAEAREKFAYDREAPLRARLVSVNRNSQWQHEVIEVEAAYSGERLPIHLFAPAGTDPTRECLQPLVYFPGSGTVGMRGIDETGRWADLAIVVGLVQTGRCVCWPVYKGTLQRTDGYNTPLRSARAQEFAVQQTKDLRRAVDYLATRPDLDMGALTYVGWSWGGNIGARLAVVEDRFKACVIMSGGGGASPIRILDCRCYAPHLTIPVLMLGGRYDTVAPYETHQLPLFKTLASQDKRFEEFPSGHVIPLEQAVQKVDEWLSARFRKAKGAGDTADERIAWLRSLATGYAGESRHALAEQKYAQLLELLRATRGEDDLETLQAARNHARAIESQGRQDEARKALEQTYALQSRVLGIDHEQTRETTRDLAKLCSAMASQLSFRPNDSLNDREQALALALRASALGPPAEKGWWLLALAQMRTGDWPAAAASLEKSLAHDAPWAGQWLLAATLAHQRGDKNSARDWYAAACELITRYALADPRVLQLRNEAALLLDLPVHWPPAEWAHADRIALYSRLIQQQPGVAMLHHRRGVHCGATGDWEQAAGSFAGAARIAPQASFFTEAHAAARLQRGEFDAQAQIARAFLTLSRQSRSDPLRMDAVVTCSLNPRTRVDPTEALAVAEGVWARSQGLKDEGLRFFYRVARGMALYRCDKFEEAIECLPLSGSNNPKDEILALIYRAMAHHRVADAYYSRLLLKQAQERIHAILDSPDGPEFPYQDRCVVWCMAQVAMREAEALMTAPAKPAQ